MDAVAGKPQTSQGLLWPASTQWRADLREEKEETQSQRGAYVICVCNLHCFVYRCRNTVVRMGSLHQNALAELGRWLGWHCRSSPADHCQYQLCREMHSRRSYVTIIWFAASRHLFLHSKILGTRLSLCAKYHGSSIYVEARVQWSHVAAFQSSVVHSVHSLMRQVRA